MDYRVLVSGSVEWPYTMDSDELVSSTIRKVIEKAPENRRVTLVTGAARGAETLATRLAQNQGWQVDIHFPRWSRDDGTYNPRAGIERNKRVFQKPIDILVAFRMTECFDRTVTDCIRRATRKHIPVVIAWIDGSREVIW